MQKESQNIEWKETWHNDHFKWICGFANAKGGRLFIGKDNKGHVKQLANANKLLEDIPNQVRDMLGLMVEVNLQAESGKDYLEIVVEPYPVPVSLRGKYYYRSGSTLQELKGAALTNFLLQRQGKRWDGVPVSNVSADDLKNDTFDFFRKKATKSKRLEPEDLAGTNQELLESLQLFLEDEKMLKRAAVLLFHPKPEKYVSGAYIKIGFFKNEADLIFQDEIHGNLFDQVEQTMDLLFTKYIKAIISYEGISRVETYEYPQEALREALLNAVAHKDYSGGTPIQIKVYDDRIMIWNEGHLPENWTINNLLKTHASRPFNPDIANTLFRSGYIESWGRGIAKMTEHCIAAGIPKPNFVYEVSDFWVKFQKDIYYPEYLLALGLNERQVKAVVYVKENRFITNSIYQKINTTKQTLSSEELSELVEKRILKSSGIKGRGAKYFLQTIVR